MKKIAIAAAASSLLAACATTPPPSLSSYTVDSGVARSPDQLALSFEKADLNIRIDPKTRSIQGDARLKDEAHHDALRAMCALDLVGNNTDRKSGHVLLGLDGRIRGIDHGLMFHHEFKLRTVIWEFGGQPIPDRIRASVARLVEAPLPSPLAELLDPLERDALVTRARALLAAPCFPIDETGRRYPWPLV